MDVQRNLDADFRTDSFFFGVTPANAQFVTVYPTSTSGVLHNAPVFGGKLDLRKIGGSRLERLTGGRSNVVATRKHVEMARKAPW